MFINCPYCNALVATDPATDDPPEHCPRCSAELRKPKTATPPTRRRASTKVQAPVVAPPASDPPRAAPAEQSDATAIDAIAEEAARASDMRDDVAVVAMAPMARSEESVPAVAEAAAAAAGTDAMNADVARDDDTAGTAITGRVDADSVAEAVLGTGAVEVEIDGAMPDEVRESVPADDEMTADEASSSTAIEVPGDATPASIPQGIADIAQASSTPAAAAAPAETVTAIPPAHPERRGKPVPSFVRGAGRRAAGTRVRSWRAPLAVAGLASLLVLQLLLADRAALAESARWRPWIASLCSVLRCTIPPWREAQAFTLVERDVRPHPSAPGVLRVTASFRNDARWSQPWPQLALTLSDVDGREAGTRRFAAAEYLGAAPAQPELRSGQTATIAMDVIEPAPGIVAFTFEFH